MSKVISIKVKKNGKLDSKSSLKNGVPEGLHENFYLNGIKSSEGNYKDGLKDGEWKYFYESGKLSSVITYYQGNKEGLGKKYYPSVEPELMVTENFKTNKRHGSYKKYYDELDGSYLMIDTNYNDGKLHGFLKRFDENGVLRELEFYEEGNKSGVWEFYNEDSKLIKTEVY